MAEDRRKAIVHSEIQKAQQKRAFDKHAQVHGFQGHQMVLVHVNDFLNKNRKLATKFEGPFQIETPNEHYCILRNDKGKLFKRNILAFKAFPPNNAATTSSKLGKPQQRRGGVRRN